MYNSNSCLAEAYCQASYAADNHDVIAEAFCRAIKTFDPQKGDFKTWVGIQRSGVVREAQRLLWRVEYLEEGRAANSEECGEFTHRKKRDRLLPGVEYSREGFLTSPKAIFNAPFRKEQRKIVQDLLNSVDKRSRTVITRRYFQDKKMGEIANELGVTDSTVDRDEKKTLRFFREMLAKRNLLLDDLVA